jgi:cytoskeletal protein CcmA (bactofilin family)
MWTKQSQTEVPGSFPSQGPGFPSAPLNGPATIRPSSPIARNLSCLGSSLTIKGKISGEEDLQIDGKVEGPISLKAQKLIVGITGQLNSEVTAREFIVYGKVSGNLYAYERVEIKKDGSVIGNITTARISIEEGAHVKGRVEIDRTKSSAAVESVGLPLAAEAT